MIVGDNDVFCQASERMAVTTYSCLHFNTLQHKIWQTSFICYLKRKRKKKIVPF